MPHVGRPRKWSQASCPGANDMSPPGGSLGMTKPGFVNALKRSRTHERARLQPGILRNRGNTGDLRQRYTLRVLLYEADRLTYEKFCRLSGLPVPGPESIFLQQPDAVRVVRDLSTVEELELALALNRYALHLFDAPENLTKGQLAALMEAHGKQLRAAFIASRGYPPEDSTTPYVPVTIDGPQDHDAYDEKACP